MDADPNRVRRFLNTALALAARSDPRLSRARVARFVPTEGGTNHVAEIRAQGGAFYAKLRADPRDGAARERWAHAALAKTALAPELVTASSAREVIAALDRRAVRRVDLRAGALLVQAAVPGRPKAALGEADCFAIALLLAELHRVRVKAGPPLSGGATAPAMARFCRECLDRVAGSLDPKTRRVLGAQVAAVEREVSREWWDLESPPRALCHGDVRPANLIFAGATPRLVDFELAGLGDPLIDLARLVRYAGLSRHQELALLDGYAEATGAKELGRYFLYRTIAPLFGALSAAAHAIAIQSGQRPAARPEHAEDRIADAERRLTEVAGVKVRLRARPAPRFAGVIAVDGTAGSGKTPIAAALARALAVPHYNTGAVYRAAALVAWERGWSSARAGDRKKLLARLDANDLTLTADGSARLEGHTLGPALDLLAVEETVAGWAQVPEIRAALRRAQAPALTAKRAVIEGRDIKSALRPDAKAAFFVSVDPKRRAALVATRAAGDPKRLARALAARDRADRTRAIAPAIVPKGAVRIDGGGDIEAIVAQILRRLRVK